MPVTGAIAGNDESGNARVYFGDTGVTDTTTDNYKFKAGYELNDWSTLLNVAYEDRNSGSFSPNSYVRDSMGNTVWSGDVIQDGQEFSIPANRLSVSEFERQSLSLGLRLKGKLTDSIMLESSINQFDIVNDENRASAVNPADPAYTPAGQIADFDNSGWQTAEVKLVFDAPGAGDFRLVTGARHEEYKLNTNVYNSDNYMAGSKDELTGSSGGETGITAFYVQANQDIGNHWDTSLGGRFESWKSRSGYYADDDTVTPELDIQHLPARSKDKFSPKFSLGYKPVSEWTLRYSWARAYRFPIVEELFSQYQAYNAVSVANPELKPENGLHHNLLLERSLDQGYLRLNFFAEKIQDVIESQATILPGGVSVRTFIPVDEVKTRGVELILNAENLIVENLDIRFNIVYTNAEIVKNNADPGIEGNIFPRMPKWRGNLLATYHIFDRWDIGGSVQYASDGYGKLDNTDNEDKVFNAQDGYTRIGLKTSYRLNEHTGIAFGVDNLSNEIAYVAHPWPGRTFYMNVSCDL
jgi:iron complex outermembrane receptor protein